MTALAPPPLPSAIEAEQAVLGVLLTDAEAVYAVPAISAECFHEPLHARLFYAIKANAAAGRGAQPALLAPKFANDPAWNELGGLDYLGDLIAHAPPAANVGDYAAEVMGAHARRELLRASGEVAALACDLSRDLAEVTSEAERLVGAVSDASGPSEGFSSAGNVVSEAITEARDRAGRIDFTWGLRSLDAQTGGLRGGETAILAARPGMGKTVAACNLATANADAGRGVCLFSLEMSKAALGLRLATDSAFDRMAPVYSGETTNPTAHKAALNLLDASQWARLDEAQRRIARLPLLIDDRPGLSLARIEAAARRAHRRWRQRGIEPGPVILDHLGKVRPPVDRRGNMAAEMADLSAGAAEMAKRLGVPVVALVQLNRAVEGREDKRPLLSDLRQAGQLEEDARQVVFLYRPEYYLRDGADGETFEQEAERLEKLARVRNQLFFLVEKNSHGPRGQVQAFCDIACSAIRDLGGDR